MEAPAEQIQRQRIFSEESVDRILIGVTGGSAAGKTTLCQNIQKLMSFDINFNVLLIALDSFYKPFDMTVIDPKNYNFDHPDSLDFDMAYNVLKGLLKGEIVDVPKYCFVTNDRLKEMNRIAPTEVIIFEGILALYDRRIRDLMKYKIFIKCDDDVRLCRRIKRDVEERGRTVEGVLSQYHRFVKDAFVSYIAPTMKYADLIIPGFRNNKTSVTFIVEHLKTLTRQMQFYKSALTTRIYFFGQVIDVLLQQSIDEQSVLLDLHDEMEYIFPVSEYLKNELDLFMNQLISERFTQAYYKSTFIHQFMRILALQLVKLMQVKKYGPNSIQLFKTCDFTTLKEEQYDQKKTIHAVFVPLLTKESFDSVLQLIERKPDNHKFMILNIWCDHRHIMRLKKHRNCCIINLICLCDQRKFIDLVVSNVRERIDWETLFFKEKVIKKSLDLLGETMVNRGADDL